MSTFSLGPVAVTFENIPKKENFMKNSASFMVSIIDCESSVFTYFILLYLTYNINYMYWSGRISGVFLRNDYK